MSAVVCAGWVFLYKVISSVICLWLYKSCLDCFFRCVSRASVLFCFLKGSVFYQSSRNHYFCQKTGVISITFIKVNTLRAIYKNNGFLKTDKKLEYIYIYIWYDFMKIERLSLRLDILDLARYVQWIYEIWLKITKCQRTSEGNYFQSEISF